MAISPKIPPEIWGIVTEHLLTHVNDTLESYYHFKDALTGINSHKWNAVLEYVDEALVKHFAQTIRKIVQIKIKTTLSAHQSKILLHLYAQPDKVLYDMRAYMNDHINVSCDITFNDDFHCNINVDSVTLSIPFHFDPDKCPNTSSDNIITLYNMDQYIMAEYYSYDFRWHLEKEIKWHSNIKEEMYYTFNRPGRINIDWSYYPADGLSYVYHMSGAVIYNIYEDIDKTEISSWLVFNA